MTQVILLVSFMTNLRNLATLRIILELGCGQGRDTLFFAAKGFQVYALDSSKIGIESVNFKGKGIWTIVNHFKTLGCKRRSAI